jgi:replicative DNA helicase
MNITRKPMLNCDLLDRQSPCDREAEQAVIGSLLLKPELCQQIVPLLRPEDFYAHANQRVYRQMLVLHEEGVQMDVVLLRTRLKQAGEFDDVGGDWYLAKLGMAVPTPINAENYARIVREKALLRQEIDAALTVLRNAYAPDAGPLGIAARAERVLAGIRMAAQPTNGRSFPPPPWTQRPLDTEQTNV